MYDIIIIGGGPAGLTAATYACRAGKSVLIIEKNALGGQITWSPKVENFPGFISASGTEIGDALAEQAMNQGAEVELEQVTGICDKDGRKLVLCESGAEFEAGAVIIAAGARPRALGVPREEELSGAGVCYCAVCDGAFYKNGTVAVCGGGNSALQDALLLSEGCRRVHLIHRRDSFRGEEKLVEALRARDNVEFILNASVRELLGGEELTGIVLEQNGAEKTLDVEGLFVAVGHQPDLEAFASVIELDKAGYAAADEGCATRTEGIFVAGDCRTKRIRQLTTAAADGAVAALAACEYIDR